METEHKTGASEELIWEGKLIPLFEWDVSSTLQIWAPRRHSCSCAVPCGRAVPVCLPPSHGVFLELPSSLVKELIGFDLVYIAFVSNCAVTHAQHGLPAFVIFFRCAVRTVPVLSQLPPSFHIVPTKLLPAVLYPASGHLCSFCHELTTHNTSSSGFPLRLSEILSIESWRFSHKHLGCDRIFFSFVTEEDCAYAGSHLAIN